MLRQSAIRKILSAIAFALGMFCLVLTVPGPAAAGAAKYPAKGIDVIVPFAPGAGTDLMGRVVAEALSKKWGVPVNVVNKPGGNTIIGTNEVMRAAHDGYTLLVDSPGSSSMQVDMKDLPYKVEERTFVARAAASPMAFIVPANSPWKDLKAVAEAAKKDPGILSWTSLGGTSGVDLVMQQFLKAAGIDVSKTKMVTYPGAAPATNAVAGGHVQLGAATAGTILGLVRGGNARCIGVTSTEKMSELPDVSTTGQQGLPGVNAVFWVGFSGPAGLPQNVVTTWADAVSEVLKDREVAAKLARVISVFAYLSPENFKKFIVEESGIVKELMGTK
jgi:putative tricarboxylic transport membrane protein